MLTDVLAAAPLGVAVVDRQGIVRLWNRRAEELLGWPAEKAVGAPDPSVPVDEQERAVARIEAMLANPGAIGRVTRDRIRPDGTTVQVALVSLESITLDDGDDALVVWFDEASVGDVHLRARNQLASRLVTAHSVDEVLPVLAEALRDVLGARSAVVLTPCPPRDHLHGTRGIGLLEETAESVQLSLDAPGEPWVRALAEGEVTVGHLTMGGRRRPTWFVPMGDREDRWVLAVQGDVERSPTMLGREMATGLADEAWIALQRAALVKDHADKIEILEATSRLASVVGLDLDSVVKDVTRHAAAVLSCERAALYVMTEEGGLRLAHVHASDARAADLVADDDGLALAERAAAADERVLHQPREVPPDAAGPWHEDAGAVSVMGLPLRIGHRTVGALVVAHTQAHPRGFTSLCQQVGDAVAHQAAMAVEHARLYADERRTVGQLRELDRLKADWIAGLTHDLRTPLTGLLGFVQTLQRLADDVSPEQRTTFLAAMERQARRLVSLVEDLLLAAQIETGDLGLRRDVVEVGQVIASAVSMLDEGARNGVEVDLPPDCRVIGDASHVERILQNLLDNAVTHGGDGVWIDARRDGDEVVIAVEDDGPGVPVERRDEIFERFQHWDAPGSTGLGLFLAIGIAWELDGSLQVVDGTRGGARFELRLPAA